MSELYNTIANSASSSLIVYGLMALILILLAAWVFILERRLSHFTKGSSGQSLEGTLKEALGDIKKLEKFRADLELYLTTVEKRIRQSVRGVETIRFDAFEGSGSGGKQSFASAFVNDEGDGVVISGLYARDRVSVFAKPVKKMETVHELSAEEEDALTKAHKSCKL